MDCRNCVSFNIECFVDPEDYTKPCSYYEDRWAVEAQETGEFIELEEEEDDDSK